MFPEMFPAILRPNSKSGRNPEGIRKESGRNLEGILARQHFGRNSGNNSGNILETFLPEHDFRKEFRKHFGSIPEGFRKEK